MAFFFGEQVLCRLIACRTETTGISSCQKKKDSTIGTKWSYHFHKMKKTQQAQGLNISNHFENGIFELVHWCMHTEYDSIKSLNFRDFFSRSVLLSTLSFQTFVLMVNDSFNANMHGSKSLHNGANVSIIFIACHFTRHRFYDSFRLQAYYTFSVIVMIKLLYVA